jgi:hypothetical protein
MRRKLRLLWPALCVPCACANESRGSVWDATPGASATATDGSPPANTVTSDGGEASPGDDGDGSSDTINSDARFDLGDGNASHGGGDGIGCAKVDFLFVVDNSSSMIAHQQALAASFPGFVAAIEERIESADFHIMAVDSDTRADQSDGCGECHDRCVLGITKNCGFDGPSECEDLACAAIDPEAPDDCDYVLGAGVIDDRWQQACGLATDDRFIQGTQPDLTEAFECIATTGVGGTGNELPLGAMVNAVSMNGAGECNEGFVRDDAILVVTILSDALYLGEAGSSPQPWYDALVAAKGGNASAIVVLALLRNEPDVVPGPACQLGATTCAAGGFFPCKTNYDEFVSMFGERGFMHSICIDDYTPFFASALDAIELTCDEFTPEG